MIPTYDNGSYDWYGWMWSASNRHLTASTRDKMLKSIKPLKFWAQFVGVDVEKEMVTGECPSSDLIEDFKSFISLLVVDLHSLLKARPINGGCSGKKSFFTLLSTERDLGAERRKDGFKRGLRSALAIDTRPSVARRLWPRILSSWDANRRPFLFGSRRSAQSQPEVFPG